MFLFFRFNDFPIKLIEPLCLDLKVTQVTTQLDKILSKYISCQKVVSKKKVSSIFCIDMDQQ